MWPSAGRERAGKAVLSHGCPGPSESCFEIANPLYGVETAHMVSSIAQLPENESRVWVNCKRLHNLQVCCICRTACQPSSREEQSNDPIRYTRPNQSEFSTSYECSGASVPVTEQSCKQSAWKTVQWRNVPWYCVKLLKKKALLYLLEELIKQRRNNQKISSNFHM